MLLTTDNILTYFQKENINFFNLLKSINKDMVFKGDFTCMRKGMTFCDPVTRHQKCKGCFLISILFKDDIIPEKIKIYKGLKTNYILCRSFSNPDIFKLEETKLNNELLLRYNRKIKKFYTNEEHTNLVNYYSVSNYDLNLVIINIIIMNLSKNKNYPIINNFVYHYFCNNTINYFNFKYDINNIDEINNLEKETSRKIFIQILIFFKFFSTYYFVHNEPSIEFLKFDMDLVEFRIDNKLLTCPIKVYIEPSKYSSITTFSDTDVKRFYLKNNKIRKILDLPFEDFDIDINGSDSYNHIYYDIEYIEGYQKKRIFFYKIGNRYEDFLENRIYNGIPVASKSFDIVCFLISLLLNKNYYNSFIKNYKSLIIWKGLWKKNQYDDLMKEMDSWRGNKLNNFDLVFFIVKKYYIRFDALEYLYNSYI